MKQEKIEDIISDFRESTCDINDEEVQDVLKLCKRKIEITGESEKYIELLLPDELKNYCFRKAVNTVSFTRIVERKCAECAVCV